MRYTIDRIENDIAVLEDDMLFMLNVPLSMLPTNVKEGTILEYDGERYIVSVDEESEQRKKLFAIQKRLRDRNMFKK